ncbi:MAG: hypothetical protein QW069_08660 [Candidatus Caldarchaeum sp.]
MSIAIRDRIKDHLINRFVDRLAVDGTLVFRDASSRDPYGRPMWTETSIVMKFYIRVYRVRGIEPTTLGLVLDKNFIATIPHLPSFPRSPQENDLIIVNNEKYMLISSIPYMVAGQPVAYAALARKYKSGE